MYDHGHRQLRKALSPVVASGEVFCAICHQRIWPYQRWELDHEVDKIGYRGPAHFKCNRSEGGRRGAEITNAKRGIRRRSRVW